MKFLSWMKSKIHGKDHNTIKPEPESPPYHPCKEESTSGGSSTLLSIGTFGNINLKDDSESKEISVSNDDHLKEFVQELRGLLNEHGDGESERFDLPIEKLLGSLALHELKMSNGNELEEEIAVHNRGNDIPSCSRKGSMYRKSITFLLKKAFLCGGGGFVPTPILRHPFTDPNLDRSRIDKIVKTVIRKKKHLKYLEKSRARNDEEETNANNWIKTDSEYITLDL